MFIDMAIVRVVQMAIMEVVDVPVMQHGLMTTVRAMHMVVCFMNSDAPSFILPCQPPWAQGP